MGKLKISKQAFLDLRNLIHEKAGMFFSEGKEYLLEERLSRRLQALNLSSYEEYLYFLRYDSKRDMEMRVVFNQVTTNETSFFRDMSQLDAFSTGVTPKIIEKKGASNKMMRIWSSACSTGEEPYTLAMMLMEEGLIHRGWRIDILASDICDQVLTSAKNAVYGEYAIRNTPKRYLDKYFVKGNGGFSVKPDVKRMVRFTRMNLVDHLQMRMVKEMDVIFCRNVLIYFDDNVKRKVIGYFYDSLVKNGYLIVGFSESLFNITRAFNPIGMNKCIVYQKI